MVGRFRAPRSHRRAAGDVRGQGPPDGPVPSPIPGEKAEQQTGCPPSPADPRQRARRPPSRRGGQPATEGPPSAPPRVARLLRRHAAVHAHEGVDRRVVEPVAERLVHGVEPREDDRRQRVEVPGQHLRRRHRARRFAGDAQEPARPGLDDGSAVGAGQDHAPPTNVVGPEVERPGFARDHPAVRAERRAGDVDGWKEERREGRGHGSRNLEPGFLGAGRDRTLVASGPAPLPGGKESRDRPTTPERAGPARVRSGESRARRARGTARGPHLGCASTIRNGSSTRSGKSRRLNVTMEAASARMAASTT